MSEAAFVCLIEVGLHVGDSHDLKAKRRVVRSVKDVLRDRLGAAVAETGGQDTWQRATLLCALVDRSEAELGKRADRLEAIVVTKAGEGAAFARRIVSLEDLCD